MGAPRLCTAPAHGKGAVRARVCYLLKLCRWSAIIRAGGARGARDLGAEHAVGAGVHAGNVLVASVTSGALAPGRSWAGTTGNLGTQLSAGVVGWWGEMKTKCTGYDYSEVHCAS